MNEQTSSSGSPIVSHFDDLAMTYDQTGEWVNADDLLNDILSKVERSPVLDVGAGPAVLASRIIKSSGHPQVIAIDISQAMCRQARGAGVSAVAAMAEQLPIRSGSIGTIIARQLLHYVDLQRTFQEWSRSLSRDGSAIITQSVSEDSEETLWWQHLKSVTQPLRRHWFSQYSLLETLDANGWTLLNSSSRRLRNRRTIGQFFANTSLKEPTFESLLENWQRTSPSRVDFRWDGSFVGYTQLWVTLHIRPLR